MPKNTTQCTRPGLEPGLLAPMAGSGLSHKIKKKLDLSNRGVSANVLVSGLRPCLLIAVKEDQANIQVCDFTMSSNS